MALGVWRSLEGKVYIDSMPYSFIIIFFKCNFSQCTCTAVSARKWSIKRVSYARILQPGSHMVGWFVDFLICWLPTWWLCGFVALWLSGLVASAFLYFGFKSSWPWSRIGRSKWFNKLQLPRVPVSQSASHLGSHPPLEWDLFCGFSSWRHFALHWAGPSTVVEQIEA